LSSSVGASDERVGDLYRKGMEVRERGRLACPDPDRLEALVERAGPEVDRLRDLDHVMACSGCLEEFELLRAIAESVTAPPFRIRG